MDHARMLAVLSALADGIDPATGDSFPPGSPYQQPHTIRALCRAVQVLSAIADGPRPAAAAPGEPGDQTPQDPPAGSAGRPGRRGNAGKAWTPEEDAQLAAAFDQGVEPAALAGAHGRSRLAVEIRLAKLGRLPMPENARYGRPAPPPGEASDSARPRYAIAA